MESLTCKVRGSEAEVGRLCTCVRACVVGQKKKEKQYRQQQTNQLAQQVELVSGLFFGPWL